MIKSKLYESDSIKNKNAYRTANSVYHIIYVERFGKWVPCLLTENNIKTGIERARKNSEDIYPMAETVAPSELSFWDKVKLLFK